MSNTPIPRKFDDKLAKDIARGWVVADMREKIAAKKKKDAPPVDPNDPRGQFLGLCRSLVFGGRGKMSDTTITVGDEVFDVSDLQLEYHLVRTMPEPFGMRMAEPQYQLYISVDTNFDTTPIVVPKPKRTFTNPETKKTYEADCVYEIPVRDRLTSKVYSRKMDNKKKKKLRKKNKNRNRKK